MQHSSHSIANLAAALAKAQAELVNPEKTLVATIRSDGQRGVEQSFRYASLSSGLDIVRKTLGQHEIATVQTTAIDQAAGTVNLTTTLAHSSGEWIASDWPVCAVSETATPRRMGAALTYARRYALFTLVGIAGEDDLDAPDLAAPDSQLSFGPQPPKGSSSGELNGHYHNRTRSWTPGGAGKDRSRLVVPILSPEASAILRDRLIGELSEIACSDDAATWAHRRLPEKNRLTEGDCQRVEELFQTRLATFVTPVSDESQATEELPQLQTPHIRKAERRTIEPTKNVTGQTRAILAKPRRKRDKEHVKFVASQPCLVCGRKPADAHHLRFAQHRALGLKVSDEFVVPLCRGHHREVHKCGDEVKWWESIGIDASSAARAFWLLTHPSATHQGGIESINKSGSPISLD